MKKAILILILGQFFANTCCDAQDKLILKSKLTGKEHKFHMKFPLTFELKNDTMLYDDWQFEHSTDSSITVSHWVYGEQKLNVYPEGTKVIKEVRFADIKFIRFSENGDPNFLPRMLMFAGGACAVVSPLVALDSNNDFHSDTFEKVLIGGSAVFGISSFIEWRLDKKFINYDMNEWAISRKKRWL